MAVGVSLSGMESDDFRSPVHAAHSENSVLRSGIVDIPQQLRSKKTRGCVINEDDSESENEDAKVKAFGRNPVQIVIMDDGNTMDRV